MRSCLKGQRAMSDRPLACHTRGRQLLRNVSHEAGRPAGKVVNVNQHFLSGFAAFLFLFLLASCQRGPQPPKDRWKTSPVTGIVHVDGAPAEGVNVTATPEPGCEIAYPVTTNTDENGRFAFSTFLSGDGLPEGTFSLTFAMPEKLPSGGGPDLFRGKYSKVDQSAVKFTVKLGEPISLDPVQLTTSKK